MRSRWLHIMVALWLVAWYGIVVPGHQRGMVLVPDAERRIAEANGRGGDSCCSMDKKEVLVPCHESGERPQAPADAPKKSNPIRVANCSVCAIAGLIDLPPPLLLEPVTVESGLVVIAVTHDLFPHELPGHSLPFTRGPPAVFPQAVA